MKRLFLAILICAAGTGPGLAPLGAQSAQPSRSARSAAAAAAPSRAPAKTPWGEPDIQGLWSNKTITPLERPRELGNKEFYTDAEYAERERQAVIRANDEARGGDAKSDVNG